MGKSTSSDFANFVLVSASSVEIAK